MSELFDPGLTLPTPPRGHRLLEGRTVLLTAAAGTGIGFATARRCVEEGARVLVSDAHERRVGEAAEQLSALAGAPVRGVRCDVSRQDDIDALWATATETLGHVDVLINNAGLGGTATIAEMTDEQWSRVLDISLTGTFRMTRAALRHMMPRRRGAIVNNASVLGWRAQHGQAHYAAAKAGVMALTRCAAVEAAEHNIRVNAVAPSLAMHAHLAKVTTPELLRDLEASAVQKRAAEPWEVANVIVFLASDLSSYLTGEVIAVSSQHP
jgi:3-oxoacyl-[acyl-carrier protein] reductase